MRTRLAKCTDASVSWCVVERNISDWQGGEIRRRDRYFDFAFADAETRFLGRRDVKVGRLVHCADGSVEMVRWKGKFIWLHGGETSRQGRALRFRPRAAGCRDAFPWPMQCQGSWLVQCTAAVFAFQAKQKAICYRRRDRSRACASAVRGFRFQSFRSHPAGGSGWRRRRHAITNPARPFGRSHGPMGQRFRERESVNKRTGPGMGRDGFRCMVWTRRSAVSAGWEICKQLHKQEKNA